MKNHKKFTKIVGLLSVSMFLFYACSDSFMNSKPLDEVTDKDVWYNFSLTRAFVDNIYGNMRPGWLHHMSLCVTSDNSFARERTGAHLIQAGNINPSDLGHLDWTWSHYYDIISSCNTFSSHVKDDALESLEDQDKDGIDRMIAEVKVLRAFAYHRLSSLFGGVPLITSPFSLDKDLKVKRNSYDEVVNFIIKELNDAASVLPKGYSDSEYGRITKGAALALKSRVLLYAASKLHNSEYDIQKWQNAADAAKAVIDMNKYSLNPDYSQTFTEAGNGNNEIIWALVYNNDIWQRFRLEQDLYPNGTEGGYAVTVPSQRQVNMYETKDGLLPQDDPSYDPQNPWVNRDPRFYASILYNGASWRDRKIETFIPGGKDSPQAKVAPWNASYTGYYVRKFVTENWDRPISESSSSPNWIMFRYAEILLNYAEAEYHVGNENVAREYVNKVRSRPSVNMPNIRDSGPKLLARIKNERGVELFLEEHRFFDIRRWEKEYPADDPIKKVVVHKDPDAGTVTLSYKGIQKWALPEHTYLLPIPQSEIRSDPQLKQNPGY